MQWTHMVAPIVVGMLLVGGTGCSTTSTIYRRSGPPVEADIEGGSANAIAVNTGREQSVIARSDITEVDYPGNVHAVLGGIFLGYGVLNVAIGMEDCSGDRYSGGDRTAYCAGLFIPGAVGIGMLIWGLVTNGGAKSAYSDTSLQLAEPAPPPPGYPPGYPPPPPPGSYPPGYQPYPPQGAQPGYPPPGTAPAPAPTPYAPPPSGGPPPPPPGPAPAPSEAPLQPGPAPSSVPTTP